MTPASHGAVTSLSASQPEMKASLQQFINKAAAVMYECTAHALLHSVSLILSFCLPCLCDRVTPCYKSNILHATSAAAAVPPWIYSNNHRNNKGKLILQHGTTFCLTPACEIQRQNRSAPIANRIVQNIVHMDAVMLQHVNSNSHALHFVMSGYVQVKACMSKVVHRQSDQLFLMRVH